MRGGSTTSLQIPPPYSAAQSFSLFPFPPKQRRSIVILMPMEISAHQNKPRRDSVFTSLRIWKTNVRGSEPWRPPPCARINLLRFPLLRPLQDGATFTKKTRTAPHPPPPKKNTPVLLPPVFVRLVLLASVGVSRGLLRESGGSDSMCGG